jgi:predicted SnoaL-like aldol condensation-catalyzing enzyme
LAVLVGLTTSAGSPAVAGDARAESNRRVVLAFYEAGLNRKDYAAASRFFGPRYIQHNPTAVDGRNGFARFVAYLRSNYPDAHSSVRQSFADGDFVILHVLEKLRPRDRGNAIVDIFRLEGGKIVEHWDVKQPIPDNTANKNGMF